MPPPKLPDLEKRIWRALHAIEAKTERDMMINLKVALDDIRVQMSRVYERYAKAGVLTHAEMSKYNRLTGLHEQIEQILGPVFSKNKTLITNLQKVEYEEAFYRYGWAIDQTAEVRLRWGLLNPDTVKAAVENDLAKISLKGIRQNGLLGIRRTVTQGLIQGQSYPKMARGIKEFIDRTAYGYKRIVRTEGQRAAVLGQLAQADRSEELGIPIRRIWDATLDGRTRPDHGDLDGQAADNDGLFHTAVGLIRGPLTSGVAEFDIHCRCRVREEIAGYEPKVRRIRDRGIVPYQTYDNWRKAS